MTDKKTKTMTFEIENILKERYLIRVMRRHDQQKDKDKDKE